MEVFQQMKSGGVGEWGTICDINWGPADACVCMQIIGKAILH